MNRLIGLLAALVVVVAGTARGDGQPQYTVTDLGTLSGGSISQAFGINDTGQVVGYALTSSGSAHAFLWQRR